MRFIVLRFHSISDGESPPPAPRACFGRSELIEKVVGFAENFEPFALIGGAGSGKTSIALTVLHSDRIKERFGDRRRFLRCDKFPPSSANFLRYLSKVIGAGVENPEDLISLRPFLSSREMFIILDNAESILDPQGTDAQEIFTMVDELSNFSNICLVITSNIFIVPPHCKQVEIPTLSIEAARDIFYSIYKNGERSGVIDDLVQRLDFHALSIVLLATVASHNQWDYDRLAKEWDQRHTQMLQTDYNRSLAVAVELSLCSPTFHTLGPNARGLLGVVAFFPQGVEEKDLDRLFPTIPDVQNIFDKFCILSLTYRSNGFIKMLAPFQDHLRPQYTALSPLLRAAKDYYSTRLPVDPGHSQPEFGEAQWTKSEDEDIERLLDIFKSIDADSSDVWGAHTHSNTVGHDFFQQRWHMKSTIEGLPDQHPSKPQCLFQLSRLFGSFGNYAEQKRLLTHALTLEREREDYSRVALTSRSLSQVNQMLGLYREGIPQAKEALEIYERLGDMVGQAECLHNLAWLLLHDDQLDAAEDSALRTLDLLPEKGQEYLLSRSHRVLGMIYDSKGEKEKTIDYLETARAIASAFTWAYELFWIQYTLALLFCTEGEFDDANSNIVQAESRVAYDAYKRGLAINVRAWILYHQCRLEEAKTEALRALKAYEEIEAARDVEVCEELLKMIERAMESRYIPDASGELSGYHVTPHPC